MLGSDLAEVLQAKGCAVKILDLPEWDITNLDHLREGLAGVKAAVNCAAFTNVDAAEDQKNNAFSVNAEAVGRLGEWAERHDVFIAHISTDFVFDGQGKRPWSETDIPKPVNVYGESKLAGEQALTKTGCRNLIMRVQWSYGQKGNNFISKILERAKNNQALKIVDDQIGAPTWTRDMSYALSALLAKQKTGLYHFAGAGYASRFETAKFVLDTLRLPNKLTACRSDEFATRAVRPLNSRFNLDKIQAELEYPIRSWQEALQEYLGQLGL